MRLIRTLSSALLAVAAASAWAHGGVGIEDDKCILRIGSDRAHFAGYQPEHRASQEFCEDFPEVHRVEGEDAELQFPRLPAESTLPIAMAPEPKEGEPEG